MLTGEAGVNLAFAKEFQALVGKIRKPWIRYSIVSGYAELTPSGYFKDPQGVFGASKDATAIEGIIRRTDVGLVFHSDLAGGILNYRIGVFNEGMSIAYKVWDGDSWENGTREGKLNDKKNFEYAARIEFQPLMLGFKADSAATITGKTADTTLGAKNIFVIGLGYNKEKHTPKLSQVNNKTLDRTGWTIDATFEKKYGNLVPNLQVGYISVDETHLYKNLNTGTYKKGDTESWYVMGQLLYDQVVGFGKPALGFRYETIKADGQYNATGSIKKDLEVNRLGLALNYYIKGQAARISLGFDNYKYKNAAKAKLKADGYEDSHRL
ncbi:MAG: hypothetical protein ACK4Y7_06055, partial [Caldimicrobium sp.]